MLSLLLISKFVILAIGYQISQNVHTLRIAIAFVFKVGGDSCILYVYVGHEYARIITAYDDRWQHTTIIISLIIHNPSFQMMFATFTIEADGFVACQQHLE